LDRIPELLGEIERLRACWAPPPLMSSAAATLPSQLTRCAVKAPTRRRPQSLDEDRQNVSRAPVLRT